MQFLFILFSGYNILCSRCKTLALDPRRKSTVCMTFIWRPVYHMNVDCTFNLHSVDSLFYKWEEWILITFLGGRIWKKKFLKSGIIVQWQAFWNGGGGGILLPAKLRYIFEEKLLFSVNVILWKSHSKLFKNEAVCMCKKGWCVGVG